MYFKRFTAFFLLACSLIFFSSKHAVAQNISNEGTEFWTVFPTHVAAVLQGGFRPPANYSVFITGKQASSGVVSVGNFSQAFNLPQPNTVIEIQIPRTAAYINDFEANRVVANRAIRIQVDPGKPKVVVYGHIFAGARSAASLILPKEALGQQYFSMNYTQRSSQDGKNYVLIVATEPATKVFLKRNNVNVVPGGILLNNVGDVYEYLVDDDLTGTEVSVDPLTSSCKRFAVFSGSSTTSITTVGCSGNISSDPLYQQNYPVESWGSTYGFIPFSSKTPTGISVRTNGSYFRILAKDNATEVKINGAIVAVLNSGQFYQTPNPTTQSAFITANKPIAVAQYALTQVCAGGGLSDPDMVILNPVEYNIKNITVYSSTKEAITQQYVNILIKTASASTFRVNGLIPKEPFTPLTGAPEYSFLQLSLNQYSTNNFNLSADDGFNAIAYGFGDVESYAYSAGTNLASNKFIGAVDKLTRVDIPNACRDEEFDFKLTLPYITEKLIWKLDVNDAEITQVDPAYTTIQVNGETLYVYLFPTNKIYRTSGIKTIKIIADLPLTQGGCGNGSEELIFNFEVFDPPTSLFEVNSSVCMNTPLTFTDKSSTVEKGITGWLWDFGDNQTSNLQNPTHTYTSSGKFTVKLIVTAPSGCKSFSEKMVTVIPSAKALFDKTALNCEGGEISFTDKSTSAEGAIIKWIWDFGDGNNSTEKDPRHTFAVAGTYNVKLIVETDRGCVSEPYSLPLKINPLPIVDFEMPDFCLTDASAKFTNKSSIADGSESQFTYLWNFGDPGSGALNTSAGKDPSHFYTAIGIYKVTLTVTSRDGCKAVSSKDFTVNGSIPKAEFTVLNDTKLCSDQEVIFEDHSTVDFGELTKIEFYFDNDAVAGITDDDPAKRSEPARLYKHLFPVLRFPATRMVQVKMLAYSGGKCVSEKLTTITLQAIPEVVFNVIPDVCLEVNPFPISQASQLHSAMPGTGTFSGTGITAAGMFDPAKAGIGTHTLTYTYVYDNGCSDFKTQTITVNKTPIVDAGADLTVLEGVSVKLPATATGSNLTFKWSPSTGLDRDDILNPIASPADDIIYSLTVTSDQGCVAMDNISVLVLREPKMPNTFTPNNDGVNDVWNIENLAKYPGATLNIFNRYGVKLYSSVGYDTPWDGRYQGEDLPVATYFYIIDTKIGKKPISGSITILR
ncbi:MAG TPA: PKD domain-containing protein [Sphingobacteriaceae bacterium]|nr:PKD domain-containing protein [Sphingobacteriaceae bacterium]